jgi:hypothetical protein
MTSHALIFTYHVRLLLGRTRRRTLPGHEECSLGPCRPGMPGTQEAPHPLCPLFVFYFNYDNGELADTPNSGNCDATRSTSKLRRLSHIPLSDEASLSAQCPMATCQSTLDPCVQNHGDMEFGLDAWSTSQTREMVQVST